VEVYSYSEAAFETPDWRSALTAKAECQTQKSALLEKARQDRVREQSRQPLSPPVQQFKKASRFFHR